jgi:hydroxyacylglutathione hydrolase
LREAQEEVGLAAEESTRAERQGTKHLGEPASACHIRQGLASSGDRSFPERGLIGDTLAGAPLRAPSLEWVASTSMDLLIEAVTFPPFAENTYVVGDPESRQALLVDPGGRVDALADILARHQLEPVAIVATHGHIDHVSGVAEAKARFQVPFWLHEADRFWLEGLDMQAMLFGFPRGVTPQVERWLEDGDPIALGAQSGRVIHTPGHSPGGICLFFADAGILFTGDTLFANSVGRTDLPGGSSPDLAASIRARLYPLGDDVTFYPGHGPSGRLGHERTGNPFISGE